jgi:arylsulfatase
MGYGVLPGGADTFIAYGRGWANVSNTPFREFKHWVHEGGIASPLIVHWPAGLRPAMDGQGPAGGARCAEPAHVIDLMATCLAVSGAAYPAEFAGEPIPPTEGRSLVPLFTAPDRPLLPAPRPLFWEHEGHQAMRLGRWKLVRKYKRDWELYDLETDRTELRDLAGREPARVRAMAAAWQAWADRVGVVPWTHDIPEGGWGSPKSLLPAR